MSNVVAMFCFVSGSPPYQILTFQIGSIVLFVMVLLFSSSRQFVLLNVGACHFGDIYCGERKFIWHPPIVISTFSIPCN